MHNDEAEHSPRSARSQGTPRDERFHTPRTALNTGRSVDSNEWITPRGAGSDRTGGSVGAVSDEEAFGTPRLGGGGTPRQPAQTAYMIAQQQQQYQQQQQHQLMLQQHHQQHQQLQQYSHSRAGGPPPNANYHGHPHAAGPLSPHSPAGFGYREDPQQHYGGQSPHPSHVQPKYGQPSPSHYPYVPVGPRSDPHYTHPQPHASPAYSPGVSDPYYPNPNAAGPAYGPRSDPSFHPPGVAHSSQQAPYHPLPHEQYANPHGAGYAPAPGPRSEPGYSPHSQASHGYDSRDARWEGKWDDRPGGYAAHSSNSSVNSRSTNYAHGEGKHVEPYDYNRGYAQPPEQPGYRDGYGPRPVPGPGARGGEFGSEVQDYAEYSEAQELDDLMAAGLTEQDVEDVFSFARHGRIEDIEALLDRGLPVDVRDDFGNTLLTIASQNGSKRVSKLVMRRGANINARNHKGNTPLHFCFLYGYGDTLGQYLISKGADPSARNNSGKMPFEGV